MLLAYRMPREPSTPRISVWRRLKRLGVAQLGDGLVALPARPDTREHLEWAAEEVTDAGGEATLWLARPSSRREEHALQERLAAAVAADYRLVIEAAHAAPMDAVARRRTLRRLRRTLHAIVARDFFPPPEREDAHAAVERLAKLVEVVE